MVQSTAYKTGRVYGQDISSGAAVAVLMELPINKEDVSAKDSTSSPEQILDLCCAPGLKLCAILDWLQQFRPGAQTRQSTIVGVDISENRLDVAKRVVHKYHVDPSTSGDTNLDPDSLPRIRLYHGDGTTFGTIHTPSHFQLPRSHNLVFDSDIAREEQKQKGERKRSNKSSRARERKKLKSALESGPNEALSDGSSEIDTYYDRVIVDAECSTDGSLKHVRKLVESVEEDTKPSSWDIVSCLANNQKMNDLVELQKKLAIQGFRLLRPGGFMVYSTCSLSEQQNEHVISYVLDHNKEAALVPIPIEHFGSSPLVKNGALDGTIRFLPNVGSCDQYGGGFYLARITKTKK